MRNLILSVVVVMTAGTSVHAQEAQGEAAPQPQGSVEIVEHQEHPPQQQQTPPGYGQQPVYQQPVQPYQPRPRRYREPYSEGMEIPEGATITRRVRLGLMIPGGLMFLVPYLSTALTYSFLKDARRDDRQPQGVLLVPVLGPFLAIPNLDENFEDMGNDSGTRRFWLAFNGLVQLAGLTMLVAGAIPKKYVEYYANSPVRLTPRVSADGGGLDLLARF